MTFVSLFLSLLFSERQILTLNGSKDGESSNWNWPRNFGSKTLMFDSKTLSFATFANTFTTFIVL